MQREIDFELPIESGKYTVRVFKEGGFDVLRYGEPWLDTSVNIPGAKCWLSMIFDLHAYQTGQGFNPALMPRELAESVIMTASLPKGDDGKTPLPLSIDKVKHLIALAIAQDRSRGPLDPQRIVNVVMLKEAHDATFDYDQVCARIRVAVTTAQTRGARISPSKISEDDYAEASRAGHEAFMACLKDKGLV